MRRRQIARLIGTQPRDLEVGREHALDGGGVDDLLFLDGALDLLAGNLDLLASLLDEYHRHRLAEVGARGTQHLLAARGIEPHRHAGALLRRRGRRINELIAGDDDVAL